MNFMSVRLVSADVRRLVSFYERVTGVPAAWATEEFAELVTARGTLAIQSARTLPLFGAEPRSGAAILEFLSEDVDQAYERARETITDLIQAPTTMPWGNRSLLFRDPDGNVVNLFTPVTPQAIAKFKAR
jgi:predicted enzyme related to lactoylglutathione lyase